MLAGNSSAVDSQLEGIAKAKTAGVYKGRKRSIDAGKVQELKAAGMKPAAIARELGIARASVCLALKA